MGNVISSTSLSESSDLKTKSMDNPRNCYTSGTCAPGFIMGNDGICRKGWSPDCGENCARQRCNNSGGTWVPADYRFSAYLCRPKPDMSKFALSIFTETGFRGEQECFPQEGKYFCKLPKVGSLITSDQYIVVLFSGANLDGDFISTYQIVSGGLINAKSVLIIKQTDYHPVALSSSPYNSIGPNFWLKNGLYPNLSDQSIGSYTISSLKPYYSKQPTTGIMFYSEEAYSGKTFYLGTKAPTIGQANIGFIPKSLTVFKADKIYFYQDLNLKGTEMPLEVKSYEDLAETFRMSKDDITKSSSISIPEGYIAFLYTETKFKGEKIIFSAGAYNLPENWNDKVKSAHFFTLESLQKFQLPDFNSVQDTFVKENSSLNNVVNVAPGWENAEYNVVAKNELKGGSCIQFSKLKDLGLYKTQPNTFVLDFYAGLFTKEEALNYARQLKVPYFGYVINTGDDKKMEEISENQKLHYFGGFKINSSYTDLLRTYNQEQLEWTQLINILFMPQSIFGTNLHVYQLFDLESRDYKLCNKFVEQAIKMNEYAIEMNSSKEGGDLYKEKLRLLGFQNSLSS